MFRPLRLSDLSRFWFFVRFSGLSDTFLTVVPAWDFSDTFLTVVPAWDFLLFILSEFSRIFPDQERSPNYSVFFTDCLQRF